MNLFVSNDATWIASGTTPDGTLSKPFYDLEDAINYGLDKSSPKASTQINIHLWKGTHYLLYAPKWFYFSRKDPYNVDFDLKITPLYCTYSDTGGINISSICSSVGGKVTVVNKRGSRFRLDAGKSLTLTDIKFDSLDSLLLPSDSTSLTCLNSRVN